MIIPIILIIFAICLLLYLIYKDFFDKKNIIDRFELIHDDLFIFRKDNTMYHYYFKEKMWYIGDTEERCDKYQEEVFNKVKTYIEKHGNPCIGINYLK